MRGLTASTLVALVVLGLGLTGCATNENATGEESTATPMGVTSGACRFVTAQEVARVTGVPTIRPTPVKGGIDACMYYYDLKATIPEWSPGISMEDLYIPPSTYVGFFTDPTGIDGVERTLALPGTSPVSGVGVQAGWTDYLHELSVKLEHGVARISVDKPDKGQKLRSNDLQGLAIELFRIAEPRFR